MNPKSMLNQMCMNLYSKPATYKTKRDKHNPGADHTPNFCCSVTLPDGSSFDIGSVPGSKSAAEQEAARIALGNFASLRRGMHSISSSESSESESEEPEVYLTCIARVNRRHANSIEAQCRDIGGKVRLSGELASGIQEGMLIEVRVKPASQRNEHV